MCVVSVLKTEIFVCCFLPPGEVSEGELTVTSLTEPTSPVTNFTCGTHFYEEVSVCFLVM